MKRAPYTVSKYYCYTKTPMKQFQFMSVSNDFMVFHYPLTRLKPYGTYLKPAIVANHISYSKITYTLFSIDPCSTKITYTLFYIYLCSTKINV